MIKNKAAYTISFETLTPKLFESLYRTVGWESPCIDQIETALNNSYAKFVAYDGDKPVGMVRIIGDGGMSFYIKDYDVIPEYRQAQQAQHLSRNESDLQALKVLMHSYRRR